MQKFRLFSLLLVAFSSLQAQDVPKELDLSTAVLQQYRKLAPETVRGFHWMSNGSFLHTGKGGKLVLKNPDGDILKEISLDEVNGLLHKANLDSVRRLSVAEIVDDQIILYGSNRLYNLATDGESAQLNLSYPSKAANKEFHFETASIAYTKGPNIFVKNGPNPEAQVTAHTDETQVSAGIAIHRSEFGIRKGLFWSNQGDKLGFYEMDESPVTDYPLANYTSIPGEVNMIKYPMAGQVGHIARVGVYDVKRDTTIYLKTTGPEDQYYTNFTFSPDGKSAYIAIVNRSQDEMKLNRYDASTGDFEKTLFEETHEKYVEPERGPIFLSNGRFLWFSERDGFDHLYLYKTDGTMVRQVTSGDFDVLEYHGEVDGSILVEIVDGLMSEALALVDLKTGKLKKLTSQESSFSVDFDESSQL
ncbi:MAG: DPP IV N-terminal domain-containing protein, partial [Bacteroidota bacterium]